MLSRICLTILSKVFVIFGKKLLVVESSEHETGSSFSVLKLFDILQVLVGLEGWFYV